MLILVLSAGRDRSLLQTRAAILESLGCSVVTTVSSADLVNQFFACDFDLIVLCHTIPAPEREKILRMVEHYRPSASAIVVTQAYDAMPRLRHEHHTHWVPPGPEELVRALRDCFPQGA